MRFWGARGTAKRKVDDERGYRRGGGADAAPGTGTDGARDRDGHDRVNWVGIGDRARFWARCFLVSCVC